MLAKGGGGGGGGWGGEGLKLPVCKFCSQSHGCQTGPVLGWLSLPAAAWKQLFVVGRSEMN